MLKFLRILIGAIFVVPLLVVTYVLYPVVMLLKRNGHVKAAEGITWCTLRFLVHAIMFFFGAAGTEGGIKAIERHGRHPRIIAFDLTEFTKAKLKDRTIDAIIYQNPYTQGRRAMQIANDYILKGSRPGNPRHYVDLHLLLRESL